MLNRPLVGFRIWPMRLKRAPMTTCAKPADRAELLARVKSGCRIVALTLELAAAKHASARDVDHRSRSCAPTIGLFEEQLPKAIETARRYGHSLSVVMADIDCFQEDQ